MTIAATKKRKFTKVRRRKNSDPNKLYFSNDTQIAIESFQKSSAKEEKDKLYNEQIFPAFEKLAENLINIHKFTGLHESYDELRHDCVTFLYETIMKFDPERGTKAFSYFNVVAKNWLIIKTKQKNIKIKRNVSLSNETLTSAEQRLVEDYHVVESQDVIYEKINMGNYILETLYQVRDLSKTENELMCVNSIITIFENVDEIDLLNKSAIFTYIKEITGLTSKQLTTAMQGIKKNWAKVKLEEEGFSDDISFI